MSASAYSGIFNYISKRCTTKSERSLREQFKNDRLKMARNLYTKDLKGHFGCVNAIEFSPNGGEFIASGKLLFSFAVDVRRNKLKFL